MTLRAALLCSMAPGDSIRAMTCWADAIQTIPVGSLRHDRLEAATATWDARPCTGWMAHGHPATWLRCLARGDGAAGPASRDILGLTSSTMATNLLERSTVGRLGQVGPAPRVRHAAAAVRFRRCGGHRGARCPHIYASRFGGYSDGGGTPARPLARGRCDAPHPRMSEPSPVISSMRSSRSPCWHSSAWRSVPVWQQSQGFLDLCQHRACAYAARRLNNAITAWTD